MGFELDDDELQTTPMAAARELEGRRVFALVMSAIVPDLRGVELVGDTADAVLVGGCDETLEPNQVFSYMNLARAFAEIQMGASFYCLHKNKWWQTSRGPMLDGGAFVLMDGHFGFGQPNFFAAEFRESKGPLDVSPDLRSVSVRPGELDEPVTFDRNLSGDGFFGFGDLLIDPTLRANFQALSLRATGAAGTVEWRVNGGAPAPGLQMSVTKPRRVSGR